MSKMLLAQGSVEKFWDKKKFRLFGLPIENFLVPPCKYRSI